MNKTKEIFMMITGIVICVSTYPIFKSNIVVGAVNNTFIGLILLIVGLVIFIKYSFRYSLTTSRSNPIKMNVIPSMVASIVLLLVVLITFSKISDQLSAAKHTPRCVQLLANTQNHLERVKLTNQLRGYGAYALPAVPVLIEILNDNRLLYWQTKKYTAGPFGGTSEQTGEVRPTTPGQEALEALKTITKQDFGKDKEKWHEWWQANNKTQRSK